MRQARTWLYKSIAVLLPVIFLVSLEAVFRILNIASFDQNEFYSVSYKGQDRFFPEWDKKLVMPKPDGLIRIFVLGGSAAYGLGASRPFSEILERDLNLAGRGRFEVINGAILAAGSHRVLEALKEASAYQPDLFIVHLGSNEFLEDVYFSSSSFFMKTVEAQKFLRRSHVINFFATRVPQLNVRPLLQSRFSGNSQYPLIKNDEQRRARVKFLGVNVNTMIEVARQNGAQIVFIPEIPNLLWYPRCSEHGPGYVSRSNEWNRIDENLESSENTNQKIERLKKQLEIDDGYAMTHFLLGLALIDVGRMGDGISQLMRAVDNDRTGNRSNFYIINEIKSVCNQNDTRVISIEDKFYKDLDRRLLDFRKKDLDSSLFIDHCHPSSKGHEIIAGEILRKVSEYFLSN